MKWSPKQQAAIDILDTNVLVSASAGAGKTTVLIGRLLKRMEIDRISLGEVVAITFTELAATEMRKRLAQKLSERIQETQDVHLVNQLSLLPSAHISTIHAFCLTLIENYAYVLNLDPALSQNILDDATQSVLLEKAFMDAFKQKVKEDPQGMVELAMHFDRKPENHQQLYQAVVALRSKLNTLKDPLGWIQKSVDQLKASSYQELSSDLQHYVGLHYRWKVEDLIHKSKQALELIQNDADYMAAISSSKYSKSNLEKYEKAILLGERRLQAFIDLKALMLDFDYGTFQTKLSTIQASLPWQNIPVPAASIKGEKAWEILGSAYQRLVEANFAEGDWYQDHQEMQSRIRNLGQLTLRTMDFYQAAKRKAKVMDFDDMEHLAIDILKNKTFDIAGQFKSRIKEIMVDEFQDTNEIQNEIVELISNGKNVFRVGDVKQSIYRFRNAQPQLMQRLMRKNDETHRVLYLDENYRSKDSIVDFNNVLFDQLMNFPQLDSAYTQQDTVKVGVPERQGNGDPVEIHYLKAMDEAIDAPDSAFSREETDVSEAFDLDEVDVLPKIEESDLNAHPKAMHIVNTIQTLRRTTDYKDFKDYVVLVRSNQEKKLLKDVFEEANIPHHISTKSGFFNADAIQDVLLMLNYLVSPSDDLNFIGLCLSKFVGLTEDQVARMALVKNHRPYVQVMAELYPELSKSLSDFRNAHRSQTLVEVLRAIYQTNDYYHLHCTKQNRVNLDLLFEKAVTYAQEGLSLSEFVTRIKTIDDTESAEAIPFTEEDNVVRVMTIHQSKGLEFKVVFYFTRLSGAIADNKSALIADSELGYMVKTLKLPRYLTRNNPIRMAIEMKNTMDDVQEQIRLMYVALTRAENRLIIVDKAPKFKHPKHYTSILNAIGSTHMIQMALDELKAKTRCLPMDVPDPVDFEHIEAPVVETEEVVEFPKSSSSIEFKTPSSTHAGFAHVRLNFDSTVGTNHGTQIHALFEGMPVLDWTPEHLRSIDPNVSDKDIQSLMAFYTSEIYQQMAKGDIKKEFAFHSLKDNVVLHGYMDLLSILDDKIILVDYKTDRVQDPHQLNELYRDQLLGYAEVLSRMYPNKTIETYAYSVEHQVFVGIK